MGDPPAMPNEHRGTRDADAVQRTLLSRAACLELLTHAHLGRLILSIDCLPAARPVLLALIDDAVIAAIGPGPEVDAVERGDVVALEIDGTQEGGQGTWSVRVTGAAERVTWDESLSQQLASTELAPLLSTETPLLKLSLDLLDGERTSYGIPAAP
jgi:nitroimidazol reductase NimA-like FMN-containing flavoprotein (pyridoxamine 5'-phosphate oxidase superfamily)